MIVRERPLEGYQKSVSGLLVSSLLLLESVCMTAEQSLLPTLIVLTPRLHTTGPVPHLEGGCKVKAVKQFAVGHIHRRSTECGTWAIHQAKKLGRRTRTAHSKLNIVDPLQQNDTTTNPPRLLAHIRGIQNAEGVEAGIHRPLVLGCILPDLIGTTGQVAEVRQAITKPQLVAVLDQLTRDIAPIHQNSQDGHLPKSG